MAASLQQNRIAGAGGLERRHRRIEICGLCRGVETAVSLQAEPGGLEDLRMVRPGRIADEHPRTRPARGQKIRSKAQGTCASRGLGTEHSRRSPRAEDDRLQGVQKPDISLGTEVGLGVLHL